MEKIFWLMAAVGAATFLIQFLMGVFGIQSKKMKSLFRYASIFLIVFGWLGLASLPGHDFFNLPFYPALFFGVVGYFLVALAVVFYVARRPAK
ncbi:MAG: hypothetical protein Q8L98_03335 [Chlamydiales bacterium]|nr:hypothetical protein [Chlamydiales bacterium]